MKCILFSRPAFFTLLFFVFLSKLSAQNVSPNPSRNDHIFPSQVAAKSYIDFDGRGFLIHGKRTFIVSAGIEYARVPRGLWHDRLLRIKRAGFNAVEIYTFWNYHEPKEGEFDFSGDQDLDSFLKLVKKMGMYTIVRVGPYYCGEWNFGGFPIWLKFKPGLRVREDNRPFLEAVDNFFNKLIPIVAKNQINRGGSVIMVQLENEHNSAWGTVTPNAYFSSLKNKTLSLGIEVPYYFSGLHPGNDPASNKPSLDDPMRPNPWFSSEYWSVWFSNYGPQPNDSITYDRRTWKILAHGGNGYNVYMAHGGSNFDYNNDRDMAASYDYGAAVGQGGDLRPIYYAFKKAAWFARSFQDILANSQDASSLFQTTINDSALTVTARSSPSGTIVFLDNQEEGPVEVQLNAPSALGLLEAPKLKISADEIMPLILDFPLTADVKIAWAPARIYGMTSQDSTHTLLVHGVPGDSIRLYFTVQQKVNFLSGAESFRVLPSQFLELRTVIFPNMPTEYSFEVAGKTIRIVVVNSDLAAKSWIVEIGQKKTLVVGPSYAAEAFTKNGKINLRTEHPWNGDIDSIAWVYLADNSVLRLVAPAKSGTNVLQLHLTEWSTKDAAEAAYPKFNDKRWLQSENPLQMGADGDITANVWYRTNITVPETGIYTLKFSKIRERVALFLNGIRLDSGKAFTQIDVNLKVGEENTIALFTAHDGRNKEIFYVGPVDTVDVKGLAGPISLHKDNNRITTVGPWRMKGGPGNPNSRIGWTRGLPKAKEAKPMFYRSKFEGYGDPKDGMTWRLITSGLTYGSVWVNGHNLGRYPEKIKINGLYIPNNWIRKGKNSVVIYDEGGALPNRVSVQAEVGSSRDVTMLTENPR